MVGRMFLWFFNYFFDLEGLIIKYEAPRLYEYKKIKTEITKDGYSLTTFKCEYFDE